MGKDVEVDVSLIAKCGLYCAACGAFLKGRCKGCKENVNASWCKVRTCCCEAGRSSCAECASFQDPSDCSKFNNFISRIFAFIFRSDRAACIKRIREAGPEAYASEMAKAGLHSIKRK